MKRTRIWIIGLKAFGYLWLAIAGTVIIIGTIGVWMKDGFGGVQDLYSPFNVVNWFFMALVLAPGIGCLAWCSKLQKE